MKTKKMRILLTIPSALLDAVEKAASGNYMDRNEFIRWAIAEQLKALERDKTEAY